MIFIGDRACDINAMLSILVHMQIAPVNNGNSEFRHDLSSYVIALQHTPQMKRKFSCALFSEMQYILIPDCWCQRENILWCQMLVLQVSSHVSSDLKPRECKHTRSVRLPVVALIGLTTTRTKLLNGSYFLVYCFLTSIISYLFTFNADRCIAFCRGLR